MSDELGQTIEFATLQAKHATLETPSPAVIGCRHMRIIVDEAKAQVECGECKAPLNPMWVLTRMTREESRWAANARSLVEARKALDSRSRTKCRNCGSMTPISRT